MGVRAEEARHVRLHSADNSVRRRFDRVGARSGALVARRIRVWSDESSPRRQTWSVDAPMSGRTWKVGGSAKMRMSYAIEAIGPWTIDRAYPVAAAAGFARTLDEWRAFCRSLKSPAAGQGKDRELAVVARNEQGYVKGLCVYSIRDPSPHGRLLDVPVFAVASAADEGGVATELIGFLRSECNKWACAGIRFRRGRPDPWGGRLEREPDDGLFLPAGASVAEMASAAGTHSILGAPTIDQLCQ